MDWETSQGGVPGQGAEPPVADSQAVPATATAPAPQAAPQAAAGKPADRRDEPAAAGGTVVPAPIESPADDSAGTQRAFMRSTSPYRRATNRWALVGYDLAAYTLVLIFTLVVFPGRDAGLSFTQILVHLLLGVACVLVPRFALGIYRIIWRYAGAPAYLRLMVADGCGCIVYTVLQKLLPFVKTVSAVRCVAMVALGLLLIVGMRLLYQWLCVQAGKRGEWGVRLSRFLKLAGSDVRPGGKVALGTGSATRIHLAIVGAGHSGVSLAKELTENERSRYIPCCFIDSSSVKAGRQIAGLPVVLASDVTKRLLHDLGVQEVVITLPEKAPEDKKAIYEFYSGLGYKPKVYDYPTFEAGASAKRQVRDFDIEELLMRNPVVLDSVGVGASYRGKVVLVTGGGGSIGSELCRQVAKMGPAKLVILDIAENGAYDVQQELRMAYGDILSVQIEIVSVCDREGLERVFAAHRPQVVLHAAAHKHVPLMEHNCCEAVQNNVFGTLNTVELAQQYGAERFTLISTDKAVNPTNVMGATKRMCEMIVQSRGQAGSTIFSSVRFGNVLGSAGSVVPLFKRQILAGGPVTLTSREIVRYFMTIPEASQLVLQASAMAKRGELFVLDMGSPVAIYDLACNMIRLMGYEPEVDIKIVETGLRPGEKLYEELLIHTDGMDKTTNELIFIEHDDALPQEAIASKLARLADAVAAGDDDGARAALKQVVPTYKSPEEVNAAKRAAKERVG